MNMQFRELAALYSFFFYDGVENQSKYPIKFAIFNEEVGKIFLSFLLFIKCKATIPGTSSMRWRDAND